MINKVGCFEKVSFAQYKSDFLSALGGWFLMAIGELPFTTNWEEMNSGVIESKIRDIYNRIKLPKRATVGSAGYDFFVPHAIILKPGASIKIPTGIRARIDEGWVLKCYPRSGLGFKYRMQLDNSVGIIDSDYYSSDNEGHIMAKITNDGREDKTIHIAAGEGFIQGIFVPYGITADDDADGIRNGGFGSTTGL